LCIPICSSWLVCWCGRTTGAGPAPECRTLPVSPAGAGGEVGAGEPAEERSRFRHRDGTVLGDFAATIERGGLNLHAARLVDGGSEASAGSVVSGYFDVVVEHISAIHLGIVLTAVGNPSDDSVESASR